VDLVWRGRGEGCLGTDIHITNYRAVLAWKSPSGKKDQGRALLLRRINGSKLLMATR